MSRTENVELTVLCLISDDDRMLLQNRIKKDWQGYTLPGGHVEPGESFVDAVIREMKGAGQKKSTAWGCEAVPNQKRTVCCPTVQDYRI